MNDEDVFWFICSKIICELQWNPMRNLPSIHRWHFISMVSCDGLGVASLDFSIIWNASYNVEHITCRWFNMICVFISLKDVSSTYNILKGLSNSAFIVFCGVIPFIS